MRPQDPADRCHRDRRGHVEKRVLLGGHGRDNDQHPRQDGKEARKKRHFRTDQGCQDHQVTHGAVHAGHAVDAFVASAVHQLHRPPREGIRRDRPLKGSGIQEVDHCADHDVGRCRREVPGVHCLVREVCRHREQEDQREPEDVDVDPRRLEGDLLVDLAVDVVGRPLKFLHPEVDDALDGEKDRLGNGGAEVCGERCDHDFSPADVLQAASPAFRSPGHTHRSSVVHEAVAEIIPLFRRDDLPQCCLHLARLFHIVHQADEICEADAVGVGDDGRLSEHIAQHQVRTFSANAREF